MIWGLLAYCGCKMNWAAAYWVAYITEDDSNQFNIVQQLKIEVHLKHEMNYCF